MLPRFGLFALAAVLFPAALSLVLLRRAAGVDDLPLDLDPFDVDLQLFERSDGPGGLALLAGA